MSKIVFYKGMPYNVALIGIDGRYHLNGYWDKKTFACVSKSEVEECPNDPAEIQTKFLTHCREAMQVEALGWTPEKARTLEAAGRRCLEATIHKWISETPTKVLQACQQGRFGISICLALLTLPQSLLMGDRHCSDDAVRSNADDYVQFLLGPDFDLLTRLAEALPMFKYGWRSCPHHPGTVDLCCLVPFYDDTTLFNEILL